MIGRFRRRPPRKEEELNITAFLNLMVVLVPFLLMSLVFSRVAILDLKLPRSTAERIGNNQDIQLEVTVRPEALIVADSQGGVIKRLPRKPEGYDYAALSELMKQLKARLPQKKDITILAEPQTSYQTLVSVMDAVRSFKAVQAASVFDAELFPNVSLGDAPARTGVQAGGGA